jgi:protein phosphatase
LIERNRIFIWQNFSIEKSGLKGKSLFVYGGHPVKEVTKLNNSFLIDTSCVLGGKLTAFRYPEMNYISVSSRRNYISEKNITSF